MYLKTMSNYTISIPEQSDRDGLIAMHVQSWLDTYPNEAAGVSAEYIKERVKVFSSEEGREKRAEYIREAHENPDYYLRIAKDAQGAVVGFVDARRGELVELRGIYIDKSAYGSGLAMELTEPALEWLGDDQEITVSVASYNQRAIAFYEKLGFVQVNGTKRLHKDTPIEVMDMKREAKR